MKKEDVKQLRKTAVIDAILTMVSFLDISPTDFIRQAEKIKTERLKIEKAIKKL